MTGGVGLYCDVLVAVGFTCNRVQILQAITFKEINEYLKKFSYVT